jgi:glycosyltransferase involved in cell wall biosynthesis
VDDQDTMKTYGNTELPDGTSERPLVTFALLAYNQEQFIREAVEGALAQTYSPLEIILSDDCSSDQTYNILKHFACTYAGEKKILLLRQPRNKGIAEHINCIISKASGNIIILAAGDDISVPERTSLSVGAMLESGCSLVHSNVTYIDIKSSEIPNPRKKEPLMWSNFNLLSAATSTSLYIGATGVINKGIWESFGPIRDSKAFEDLVFGFRSCLLNGSLFVPYPLVRYRIGAGITYIGDEASVKEIKSKRIAELEAHIATFRQRLSDLRSISKNHTEIAREMRRCLQEAKLRKGFILGWGNFIFLAALSPTTLFKMIKVKYLNSRHSGTLK